MKRTALVAAGALALTAGASVALRPPEPPGPIVAVRYLPRVEPGHTDPRTALLAERYGFGRHAGDGADSWPRVIARDESTLRGLLADPAPLWVYYDGPEELRPDRPLLVASSTVLQARGLTIIGHGLVILRARSVIIDTIDIRDAAIDGVSVRASHDVWLRRVRVLGWGDGAIDVTARSSGVTITDAEIARGDKAILVGGGRPDDNDIRVTIQGGHLHDFGRRAPRVRGYVHMLDTLVERWDGTAADVSDGGRLYLERVRFVPGRSSGPAAEIADGANGGAVAAVDVDAGGAAIEVGGHVTAPAYGAVAP